MIDSIHIKSKLCVPFPERKIFFRLGGSVNLTQIDESELLKLKSTALKAACACAPQGRWRLLEVKEFTPDTITFSDGSTLTGSRFIDMAKDATHIWFGAVTAGKNVIELRDKEKSVADQTVCDAAASEIADCAMDMLQNLAASELLRCGIHLAQRRFSPGYGNMPLDTQKLFFTTLKLEEMGLKLSDNCYITPEKSVTAVAAAHLLR